MEVVDKIGHKIFYHAFLSGGGLGDMGLLLSGSVLKYIL